jgi:hypothetical protein
LIISIEILAIIQIINSGKLCFGHSLGLCPPCADYFAANDKLDFVEKAGGDWLMKNIQDAWVVWM